MKLTRLLAIGALLATIIGAAVAPAQARPMMMHHHMSMRHHMMHHHMMRPRHHMMMHHMRRM